MCGKDDICDLYATADLGSPPRVREGRCSKLSLPLMLGITPACAGRTDFGDFFHHSTEDHPRVCGKDCVRSVVAKFGSGSPPRVREGLPLPRYWGLAGRDHPRVCGKDCRTMTQYLSKSGSPPRVREGQGRRSFCSQGRGITPACAGRTSPEALLDEVKDNHPRVCGKDLLPSAVSSKGRGSPPRVREGLSSLTAS